MTSNFNLRSPDACLLLQLSKCYCTQLLLQALNSANSSATIEVPLILSAELRMITKQPRSDYHRLDQGFASWEPSGASFNPQCSIFCNIWEYFCVITFEPIRTYALSFYRSQNILGQSKFFVPYQKLIYILCQSQTFCARPKDDFHIVNSVFVPAQNFLKGH